MRTCKVTMSFLFSPPPSHSEPEAKNSEDRRKRYRGFEHQTKESLKFFYCLLGVFRMHVLLTDLYRTIPNAHDLQDKKRYHEDVLYNKIKGNHSTLNTFRKQIKVH